MKGKALLALVVALADAPGFAQDMMQPVPDEMKQTDWMVGTWEGETVMMGQASKTTMVCDKVLGGRYLRQMNSFSMGGTVFEGLLLMTYDAKAKDWVSWWYDSAGPGAMEFHGKQEGNKNVSVSKPFPMEGMPDIVMRTTMEKLSDTKFKMVIENKDGDKWSTMAEVTMTKKG